MIDMAYSVPSNALVVAAIIKVTSLMNIMPILPKLDSILASPHHFSPSPK